MLKTWYRNIEQWNWIICQRKPNHLFRISERKLHLKQARIHCDLLNARWHGKSWNSRKSYEIIQKIKFYSSFLLGLSDGEFSVHMEFRLTSTSFRRYSAKKAFHQIASSPKWPWTSKACAPFPFSPMNFLGRAEIRESGVRIMNKYAKLAIASMTDSEVQALRKCVVRRRRRHCWGRQGWTKFRWIPGFLNLSLWMHLNDRNRCKVDRHVFQYHEDDARELGRSKQNIHWDFEFSYC